jgi:hypothetical protein
MSKERKTRKELEEIVFAEVRKFRACEGTTGVTVRGIDDKRVDYNWEVSHATNATPECVGEIEAIVDEFQKRYEMVD